MLNKANHLVISGLGDADTYRMSAESRKEAYKHVVKIAQADDLIHDYKIICIDSSNVHRINHDGDYESVDVKSERLNWLESKAGEYPNKLFVIAIWDDESEWDGLLQDFDAKNWPNVIVHNIVPASKDKSDFLGEIVDRWQNLSEE